MRRSDPFRRFSVSFVLSLSLFSTAFASDWTQFRGPNSSGISPDKNVPAKWSDTENVKWKLELPGRGSSSPIILGDRVYVTCFSDVDDSTGNTAKMQRHLVAIDRTNGKVVWDTPIAAEQPEDPFQGMITQHGYASQTPITDGQRIYVFFGKSGVLAFDLHGKKLWQTNVGKESSQMHWGSGASPVLYKDKIIVNASDESQSIRAIDAATGKEVWKAEAAGLEQIYSTPTLVTLPDGKQEVVISATGELWGLDPETGKLRWFATTRNQGQISPSVVADAGIVYSLGGRGGGLTAIRAGGKGDVTDSNIVWSARGGSNVPTPVLHEGHLYWVDDNGVAHCIEAKSGKVAFEKRLEGLASTGGFGGGGFGGGRPPAGGGDRKSDGDRKGDGGRPNGDRPGAPREGSAQGGGGRPGGPGAGGQGNAGKGNAGPGGAGPGGAGPGGGGRGRGGPGGGGGGGPAIYASVVCADGKLFVVTRRSGTFVIAAKPEFEQIAHNKFESDDSQFNASPAISNSELFIRSDKYLYCIAAK